MHALLLALTLTAATPPPPAPQRIEYRDDEVVEGNSPHGDGDLLLAHKRARVGTLIRLRTHFFPELVRSADDL